MGACVWCVGSDGVCVVCGVWVVMVVCVWCVGSDGGVCVGSDGVWVVCVVCVVCG